MSITQQQHRMVGPAPRTPVRIHSYPAISDSLLAKWQNLVDLMAQLVAVPAGLIMRVDRERVEVLVSSHSEGNPYYVGDSEHLPGSGLYCETVLRERDELLVPNASLSERWRNNPDVKLNMISYLGYPISWPNGDLFGTICVLDSKQNTYSEQYKMLLQQFRTVIENNLELLETQSTINGLNERFEMATRTGAVGVWEIEFASWSFAASSQMRRLIGLEEPVGSDNAGQETHFRHWLKQIHGQDLAETFRRFKAMLAGGAFTDHVHRVVNASGAVSYLRTSARIVHDDSGQPVRAVGTCVDVSREREAENALREAEKLALVARIASAMSHEINNPLQGLTNLLHLAVGSAQGTELETVLVSAQEQLTRISRNVSHTLRVHHQTLPPVRESIGEIMKAAVARVRPELSQLGIDPEIDVAGDLQALCYRTDLEHAIVNLLVNAVAALQGIASPRLIVRSRRRFASFEDPGIVLTVADNGCGIDPTVMPHLFRPFVSTKGEQATGLGLWIAKGIFDRHQASISVRTSTASQRHGTAFRIVFPQEKATA